uniref:Hypothetical chloroplast RF20 n=1 Tax=Marvania geminata TaxID=97105 RepID=A0A097KRA0_9CHLO|nr:hypothetical chloroplast RF20 [Marvania geminata]AIT95712.1 hypothetical chloroplast RF20 [Marvania geminata]
MNIKNFILKIKAFFRKNSPESIKKIPTGLALIFLSFTFGNFFGLGFKLLNWPAKSLFVPLIFVEIISFFMYSKALGPQKFLLTKNLNFIKFGFLIGIFVEAFKVGS